jgi:uncharacterized repeat protein (TIGR01451 family)
MENGFNKPKPNATKIGVITLLMVLLSSIHGFGQLINSFDIHFQIQQKGSIAFVSNASVSCGSATGCGASQAQNPPSGNSADNDYSMTYINIDPSTSGIYMASSDSLKLPNCSEVTWAGLYWGGAISSGTTNYAKRDSVKLKVNTGSYQNLKADTIWNNSTGFTTYHCFKNITSIVKANGANARYTLANMPIQQASNAFGGWTIVVVYKNDLMDMRNLTVFSGLASVSSGANSTVDIPINGFLTPPAGPINFELGLVVYDGDRASTGDSLLFKGGSGNFIPISDAVNNANDVFNSTISYNGALTPYRNPSYNNTLGYDADIFKPVNTAKNYLNNSMTSAVIRQRTGSETFLTQVVTSAIDVYEPDMKLANQVVDINGGTLDPGDIIEYTLTLKNIGSDIANNTIFEDTLGFNINYVPGSMRIVTGPNAGVLTEATGDDQGEYNATSRSIKVRIGTGANATTGGNMVNTPTGVDSTVVRFRATVTTECTKLVCDNVVSNLAYLKGVGQISGNFLVGASNPDFFDAAGCPVKGSTVTALNAGLCSPFSASSNSPVCIGSAITLFSPSTTNATYAWSGPNGFTSNVQNPIIPVSVGADNGIYTVTITYMGSPTCSSMYSTTVVVSPVVNIAAPETSCTANDDKVLSGTTVNMTASGGTTYNWSSSLGTGATKTVTPTTTTTYTVTVTDANGCVSTGTKTITIISLPTTTITATEASCTANDFKVLSGGTVNLSASGTGTFAWNSSLGTGTPKTANPTGNTTYRVTLTDANGCTATSSRAITIIAAPTTTITATESSCTANDDKVLGGANVNLSASGTGTFAWDNSLGSGASKSITPSLSTTYNVTLTDANGCTVTNNKLITIISLPTTAITATENSCTANDDKVLSGDNVNLTASGVGTFAWDNSLGSGSAKSVTPSVSTTYTVTLTDANGCTATANKTITIISAPSTAITVIESSCGANDDIILIGESANLTASGAGTFAWDNSLGNGSSKSVTPSVSTTYNVTLTDANGCTATANKTITVDILTISSVGNTNPTLATCPALNDGTIAITASGSNVEYSINNGTTWQASNTFNSLTAGSFSIKIRNTTTTCTVTHTTNPVVLTAPTCVEICDDGIDNDGNGFTDCFDTVCKPSLPSLIKREE